MNSRLPDHRLTPPRAIAYFIALLILGTGALLVTVASTLPTDSRVGLGVCAVAMAGVVVLLVHQPVGRVSLAAAILAALSFILPPLLIRPTPTGCLGHVGPPPCDPAENLHLGLQVGLMVVLSVSGLLAAIVGAARSPSRPGRKVSGP